MEQFDYSAGATLLVCWCITLAVTLTFDPVTLTFDFEHVQRITFVSVRNLSEIEQSPAELLIICKFLPMLSYAVTLTLNFYSTSDDMR